jgi:hypothetical protein
LCPKLISSGKHRTAAGYRKPVRYSEQKEICCFNSQTRQRQTEFGRIFLASPHWFGAQSSHGYHIRWAIDSPFAFGAHCNRRTGRRRIRASSSEPGLHRPRPDVRTSARVWARVFPGRLNGLGASFRCALKPVAPASDQPAMVLSKKKLAMDCDFRHTSRSCGGDQSSWH